MRRRVTEPFQAPRQAKETTGTVRRSARQTDIKTNEKPTIIPFRKGIRMMIEREAGEMSIHGEVLRWSSGSDEQEISKAKNSTVNVDSDSEEPTEFGVVWERYDANNKKDGITKPLEVVLESEEERASSWSSADNPSRSNEKDEAPPSVASSPHLSEFEALLERLEHAKKVAGNGSNCYVFCDNTCGLSLFYFFPHVDRTVPEPGGRWDVALSAERSAWRQANGLASGPT
jgi:hypothetical protein